MCRCCQWWRFLMLMLTFSDVDRGCVTGDVLINRSVGDVMLSLFLSTCNIQKPPQLCRLARIRQKLNPVLTIASCNTITFGCAGFFSCNTTTFGSEKSSFFHISTFFLFCRTFTGTSSFNDHAWWPYFDHKFSSVPLLAGFLQIFDISLIHHQKFQESLTIFQPKCLDHYTSIIHALYMHI